MDKRIAIPMENDLLCAHFGHCQQFAIVEVSNGIISDVKMITPPEHVSGLYPRWVAALGVTDVIVGGIGKKATELFNMQHINVFVGAQIKSASELVNDFNGNKLNLSDNSCNHSGNHSCSHL